MTQASVRVDNEPVPTFPTPVLSKVDAQTEAFQRRNVIEAAKSWVGTPYRQLGYKKGKGGAVDCSMLLVAAFVEARVFEPFDPRPYSATWFLSRSEEKYLAWLDTIGERTTAPQPGDVLTFRWGRCVSHSGILIDETNMVHAFATDRICTITRLDWNSLAKRRDVSFDMWARLRGAN
jgi:cell wall-associated NlpC family hydrolase